MPFDSTSILHSTEVENQECLLPVTGVPSGRASRACPRRRAKIVPDDFHPSKIRHLCTYASHRPVRSSSPILHVRNFFPHFSHTHALRWKQKPFNFPMWVTLWVILWIFLRVPLWYPTQYFCMCQSAHFIIFSSVLRLTNFYFDPGPSKWCPRTRVSLWPSPFLQWWNGWVWWWSVL